MTLTRETIDYLASHGYIFEEIMHVKAGMKDIEDGKTLSFEEVVKNIKKGNAVSYV